MRLRHGGRFPVNTWTRTAAVLMAALLIGACAGGEGAGVATLGGEHEEASQRPPAPDDPEEALLRFAECMREHGIEVSDPRSGEGGGAIEFAAGEDVDPEELQEADAACRHLLPQGREDGPNLSPQERARVHDQLVRFAQCMRDQDLDFPDPVERDGGIVFVPEGDASLSPDDPAVQEAHETCSRFLPGDIVREQP
jgi:hypothetical protein